MERIPLLFLSLMVAMVAVEISAFPEDVVSQPSASITTSLDKRLARCINNESCPTRQQLRLLDALTDDMHSDLRRIYQTCDRMDYKNCFSPAMDDVMRWHKIHDEMRDMAQHMELQYTAAARDNLKSSPSEMTDKQLNLLEPAAGPVPNPNPYTDPEQEQLHQYKDDWWQGDGWAPEDEANPYHKW
jgi:hypothetical protein